MPFAFSATSRTASSPAGRGGGGGSAPARAARRVAAIELANPPEAAASEHTLSVLDSLEDSAALLLRQASALRSQGSTVPVTPTMLQAITAMVKQDRGSPGAPTAPVTARPPAAPASTSATPSLVIELASRPAPSVQGPSPAVAAQPPAPVIGSQPVAVPAPVAPPTTTPTPAAAASAPATQVLVLSVDQQPEPHLPSPTGPQLKADGDICGYKLSVTFDTGAQINATDPATALQLQQVAGATEAVVDQQLLDSICSANSRMPGSYAIWVNDLRVPGRSNTYRLSGICVIVIPSLPPGTFIVGNGFLRSAGYSWLDDLGPVRPVSAAPPSDSVMAPVTTTVSPAQPAALPTADQPVLSLSQQMADPAEGLQPGKIYPNPFLAHVGLGDEAVPVQGAYLDREVSEFRTLKEARPYIIQAVTERLQEAVVDEHSHKVIAQTLESMHQLELFDVCRFKLLETDEPSWLPEGHIPFLPGIESLRPFNMHYSAALNRRPSVTSCGQLLPVATSFRVRTQRTPARCCWWTDVAWSPTTSP